MTTDKRNTNRGAPPAFIGIDLAKHSIHVYGVDAQGRSCVDQKMRPARVRGFLSNLAPCIVGMEAWAGVRTSGAGKCRPWGMRRS